MLGSLLRCRPHTAAVLALGLASLAPAVPAAGQAASFDTTFFRGLTFRNVGPVRGGRSIAVSGTSARPFEYYFGATGGGVWKTTDGGTTWTPVTDRQIGSSSVGAIGQCAANPDIVYVGMGEVALRGNIMQGDGAYRSSDGGTTWRHIGLDNTQAIGRMRVHPTDCETVYAAVLGHPYGPNEERGVFRSRDGGATWERVLHRNDRTGAVDLIIDPANPDVLYATLWEVHRTPWSLSSGGPGGGLFRSADGGSSWTELTQNPGLPTGIWGKSGVTVSGADSNRVWAIIEAEDGGVFRSDDGGSTWTKTNEDRALRQRAFYYTRIYAHPTDRDQVFVLNVQFHVSEDGGETFTRTIRVPHVDNHDLWIDPTNPDRMINGNDGGGNVSVNAGQTWTEQDYPTAQLYHITTTNHRPYWVCGAQQDNSTACMPSRNTGVLPPHLAVGGGESGYIASDPEDPDIFFAGSYGGLLTRFDARTGESQRINVWPDNPMGHSAGELTERFQWTFPIMFSRSGPKRLYVGSQHLWVTTNEGMSWDRISPDLTRADPSTMGSSGGPITRDQTSVEYYGTIFTIAPSPHDANTIWVGTDDGLVQLTRDHGATWTDITPSDMPEFTRVSMIEVSPHRAGAAYVAGKRYQLDDRKPYIWYTEDYGANWRRIDSGIPDGAYVHAVREDPVRARLLFAGTELGVRVSFDNGASWSDFNRNLPVTQVPNLMVKDNDLVIGTHGRSAWIMDNISQLRQLTADVAAAAAHLFQPVDPVRGVDNGVTVTYYLREAAEKVTLDFIDASGSVVRSYGEGEGLKPGITAGTNRFTWDLRHPGPTRFADMILWAAGSNGPRVLPGRYSVRLSVNDRAVATVPFEYRLNPARPHITLADVQAQHDLAMRVTNATSAANEGVITIRDVRTQVDNRIERDSSVSEQGQALKARLGAIEEQLYQVRNRSGQDPLNYPIRLNNRIAALLGAVEGVEGRPTRQAGQVFAELNEQLQTQLGALHAVLNSDLAEFNTLLRSKQLEPIVIKAPDPITE